MVLPPIHESMNSPTLSSRRTFLGQIAATATVLTLPSESSSSTAAETKPASRYKIAGFTKPFQTLSFAETAEVVAQIGWDGIECPVRQKGQVLPERVADDLPRLAEALQKRNLELTTIATDVRNVTDPLTEKVLRAASKGGVKLYRLAHLAYDRNRPIPEQLANLRAELRELAALNKELGLCAIYENHSGLESVGAAIWDLHELFHDADPRLFGICFDIGHATIEGGYIWPTNLRLVQPHLRAVYIKDFAWKKAANQWKAEWCPLGEGMVGSNFIQALKNSPFNGPIVQHHEYPVGRGAEMIQLMKKDLATLKGWLAAI